MKPREQGGVVDSALNVYGVKGLKVAGMYLNVVSHCRKLTSCICTDMSIAPSNVGSVRHTSLQNRSARLMLSLQNTYSSAVLIGEKAATIIASELGVKI